jgi:nuclear pore complex protein Nup210
LLTYINEASSKRKVLLIRVVFIHCSGSAAKAQVLANGLVRGTQFGATRVDVKSVDRPTETIVYSEAYVDVNVVSLVGVRIHSPLSRIQSQKEMPLWAVGIGGDSELEPTVLLGGKDPRHTLEWVVSNRETAEIQHVFQVKVYAVNSTGF